MKPSDTIYCYMEDVQLKVCVSYLIEVFKPVAIAPENFQSDTCTLGEVLFEIWHVLRQHIQDPFMVQVTRRVKRALTKPASAAHFSITDLPEEKWRLWRLLLAMNYLRELDPNSMPHITNFLAKEPPYMKYLFETSYTEVKPTVSWKTGWWLGF